MNKEIAGGVTPLKLRAGKAKSRRGGKQAGKATAKKGNWLGGRGGYDKSSGKQGTGTNRGGQNIHTRFKPRAKDGPKGGGSGDTKPPTDNKPYSFDKDGKIVINNNNNNYINTPGGTQKQKQSQIQTSTNNIEKEDDKIKENNDLLNGSEFKSTPGTKKEIKKKRESYDDFWKNRIDDESSWSRGMKRYMKGVDVNDPDAVEKARLGHRKESVDNAAKRHASEETSYETTKGEKFQRDYTQENADADRNYNTGPTTDDEGWFKI